MTIGFQCLANGVYMADTKYAIRIFKIKVVVFISLKNLKSGGNAPW